MRGPEGRGGEGAKQGRNKGKRRKDEDGVTTSEFLGERN